MYRADRVQRHRPDAGRLAEHLVGELDLRGAPDDQVALGQGGRLSPPKGELFDPAYAKKDDKSDLWWRNVLENPITVQFNHRCLVSSFQFACAFDAYASSRPSRLMSLPVCFSLHP